MMSNICRQSIDRDLFEMTRSSVILLVIIRDIHVDMQAFSPSVLCFGGILVGPSLINPLTTKMLATVSS